MGQCRSKMPEIALTSPYDYYRNHKHRKNKEKHQHQQQQGRDEGLFSMDASFSESSFAGGGHAGRGLLLSSLRQNDDADAFDPTNSSKKKKKLFDYYGGTIGDNSSTAGEGDDGETKTN
jgi:hypothetical protein